MNEQACAGATSDPRGTIAGHEGGHPHAEGPEMAKSKVVATRWAVCAACGHRERLVTVTPLEIVSHCHSCGDSSRQPLVVQLGLPMDRRPV